MRAFYVYNLKCRLKKDVVCKLQDRDSGSQLIGKSVPLIYGTRKVFHGRYTVSNVAPCKHLTSVVKSTPYSEAIRDTTYL